MKKVKIGNIAKIFNGYAFKSTEYSEAGFQVIRITNVQNGYISNDNQKFIELKNKSLERFILNEGDILISLTGNVGRVGKIGKENLPAVLNQRVGKVIIQSKEVISDYLFHILKSNAVESKLIENAKGIAQKNIGSSDIENIEIPLPSLEDQKRIVKILDRADALREKRKQAIGLLDEYLKSVFLEMFGDLNANDKNWEFLEFGNYISVLTDYHANGSYEILKKNVTLLDEPDYALMVRTTDLENNNFEKDVKYIDEHAYNFLEKSKVYGGEIIINKIGSAGKVYLMPQLNRPVSLGMNAFLLRFNDNANVVFMYYLLTSHYGDTIIQKKVKGAVTKTIRKDAIRGLKVPNISINQQNKFSNYFIKVDKLKQSMLSQSVELKTQFQALMQKAFKGEL